MLKEKGNDLHDEFKKELEVDTDVNEDPKRERLLDDSFDVFIERLKNK